MNALLCTRLGFVLLCIVLAALLAWRFERVASVVRAFFFRPTLPINLGLLRAITFGTILIDLSATQVELYAGLPAEFVSLPPGWSWLGDLVPISVDVVTWTRRLLFASATLAALGLFTRPATMLAAALAVYVLGIPNFYFRIGHGNHVTVLSALILAASPCGDSFSLDAVSRWLRGKPAFPPHEAYTIPVRFCWLLIGTMYLFPGLWKLWETGDLWLSGIKLKVELFKKWGTLPNFYPAFRVDKYPLLLALLGSFTLIFEIGFILALFKRKTRVIAAFAAACFHVGVGLTMNIWFHPFHPLVVLLELPDILPARAARRWGSFADRAEARLRALAPGKWPRAPLDEPTPKRYRGGAFVVGSLLLFAMLIAGFSPIDSWPIAVYPRFAARTETPPKSSFTLRFRIATPAGVERELQSPLEDFGASVTYAIVQEISRPKRRGRRDQKQKYVALLAHVVRSSGEHFEPGARLLIYRYDFLVDPDERGETTREPSLVAEADL